MFRSEITVWLIGFALFFVSCGEATAQRHGISSTRHSGTGSMQLGQRWGTPGGGPGQTYSPISGRQSSSPAWTLRPTDSNSHAAASSYGASTSNRSYSTAPGRVQHSHSPRHAYQSYSVAPVQIQYQNYGSEYGYLNPYDRGRVQNGLSARYGVNYGPIYPTIVAPPIVFPYGGLGSTATYSVIPLSAPMPFTMTVPAASTYSPVPLADSVATADASQAIGSQTLSPELPVDELPVVNEFGDGRLIPAQHVSAVDRIRSLRYQASGDDAFRRLDYASAAGLYKAAADVAPQRQAPLLRSAWTYVALKDFPAAVVSLKTALLMADDPTSSWIASESLYGKNTNAVGAQHGDELWQWLQQRPNSTDRLLLTAAFQKLLGYSGVSRELLQAASIAGLDAKLERALMEISAQPNEDDIIPSEDAGAAGAGIHMKDSEVLPANHAQVTEPGLPEPLLPDEEVLVPQERKNLSPEPVSDLEGLIIPGP